MASTKKQTEELMVSLVDFYGVTEDSEQPSRSLRRTASEFNISLLKARKLLVTAGVFSSDICKTVNKLRGSGKTISEIMEDTGLSRASVHSYLPYSRTVYKSEETTLDAERSKTYRLRKESVQRLRDSLDKGDPALSSQLWQTMIAFQGYSFITTKKLRFTYKVKGFEIKISRKEKTITKATVDLALKKALQLKVVSGPKQLGVFGASYLYPVFLRLGVIEVERRQDRGKVKEEGLEWTSIKF